MFAVEVSYVVKPVDPKPFNYNCQSLSNNEMPMESNSIASMATIPRMNQTAFLENFQHTKDAEHEGQTYLPTKNESNVVNCIPNWSIAESDCFNNTPTINVSTSKPETAAATNDRSDPTLPAGAYYGNVRFFSTFTLPYHHSIISIFTIILVYI